MAEYDLDTSLAPAEESAQGVGHLPPRGSLPGGTKKVRGSWLELEDLDVPAVVSFLLPNPRELGVGDLLRQSCKDLCGVVFLRSLGPAESPQGLCSLRQFRGKQVGIQRMDKQVPVARYP